MTFQTLFAVLPFTLAHVLFAVGASVVLFLWAFFKKQRNEYFVIVAIGIVISFNAPRTYHEWSMFGDMSFIVAGFLNIVVVVTGMLLARISRRILKKENKENDVAVSPIWLKAIPVILLIVFFTEGLLVLKGKMYARAALVSTSPGELSFIHSETLTHPEWDLSIPFNLLKNSRTPPEVLYGLSTSGQQQIRLDVATHPNTTRKILETMREDWSTEVKITVLTRLRYQKPDDQ